jgi:hypothetical protein
MFCSLCKQKTVNEFIWGLHQFYFTPNYDYWHELINRALLKSYNTDVISLQIANVKPLYEERDFSQANLLDKLKNTLEAERLNALRLEGYYYRSVRGKSFKYSKLAGG